MDRYFGVHSLNVVTQSGPVVLNVLANNEHFAATGLESKHHTNTLLQQGQNIIRPEGTLFGNVFMTNKYVIQ